MTASPTADNSMRSIDRAFRVLSAVASADRSLSLAELSRRAEVPAPTGLRIARALVHQGLLQHVGGGYRLGPGMAELARRGDEHRRLLDLALPVMSELYCRIGGTVHLAVLEGASTLIVEKIAGPRSPVLASRPGHRGPAHCTGLGKVLLAHSPRETVDRVIAAGLAPRTRRTTTGSSALLAQLAHVRRTGLGVESGESVDGVGCVAAPVFGPAGALVAAISVAGDQADVDPGRHGPAVRGAAAALSRLLLVQP